MKNFNRVRRLTFAALMAASQPIGGSAQAQDFRSPPEMTSPHAVQILPEVRLYSKGASGTPEPERKEQVLQMGDKRIVVNVTEPAVTPFLPPKEIATGTAVIIAPGGGYYGLAMDTEGMREAQWLADRGIAAFVLKYRTKPIDPDTTVDKVVPFMAAVTAPKSDIYGLVDFPPAVSDGDAAIKLVRSKAAEWAIDPKRVVFMGFSAGAFTTLKLATSPDIESRPNYAAPIYPSLDALPVPKDVPPMFGAIALDDELFKNRGFGLLSALQASGRPFEFHLYERGGHGFGMGTPGTTTLGWINDFYNWLGMHGLTTPKHRQKEAPSTTLAD